MNMNERVIQDIKIGNRAIGEKHPVFIIAEIGLNHQGDLAMAKRLIDAAVLAGADCVKFQKRSLAQLYKEEVLAHPERQEHALQYLLDHIVKCELSEDDMRELHRYSLDKGTEFLCTPWDEESLHFLSQLNLPAYKIGSPDMFNLPLINQIVRFLKRPVIISTGMSFMSEIDQVIDFLHEQNARYVLLHCNSTYPSPYEDLNLRFLQVLRDKCRYAIGYSGHERGISVAVAAVALGARVIEKHITLDRTLPGPDHKASLLPAEFSLLVEQIRKVEAALGDPVRFPSRGEFMNRENLSKSLVVNRDMKVGEVLKYEDIALQSPGKGTNPLKLRHFIGRKLILRDLPKGEYLLESDVDFYDPASIEGMEIRRMWGVVARATDIDELIKKCKPRFVEIHLTSSDIDGDAQPPQESYGIPLVIHGPEYHDDLLLDLSSRNPDTRAQSVAFFNRALDHARRLKTHFSNKNERVKFIVHPGGMDMVEPLSGHIAALNANLLDSLRSLEADGFELLIENMPPCPWYFGGQWYHSSMMRAEEIAAFSRETGFGVCFDVSHAALYCNVAGVSLDLYTKTILPVAKYVQIADAAKSNGEGIKIGDGTVQFRPILDQIVPTDLWVLPEIWQGHKFGGEDFIGAIRNLKLIHPDF